MQKQLKSRSIGLKSTEFYKYLWHQDPLEKSTSVFSAKDKSTRFSLIISFSEHEK